MIVKQFKGRGRRAVSRPEQGRGGWLFRLFMRWFTRAAFAKSSPA